MDVLYIVIPAYNEEENISQVISDWYPIVEAHDGGGESRLVILDDGSSGTRWDMVLISSSRLTLTVRLCRKSLNRSGSREMLMIW